MGALYKGGAEIHAAGKFDTTAGAIVAAGTGDWSAANVAVGIADITLQVPIDVTERVVILQTSVANLNAATIPASDTDTNIRVHVESDVSADTDDPALGFIVFRANG